MAPAARNNALWCDAVCRANGAPGAFLEPRVWLTRGPAPAFYPNLVTLSAPGPDRGESLLAPLRSLAAAGLPAGWGAKDSYAGLDLTPLGFRPRFEATWIWRPPGDAPPAGRGLRWARVRDAAALAAWESAWSGRGEDAGPVAPAAPTFRPSLLADGTLAFLIAYDGRRPAAGAVATRAAGVVGISNVFARGVEPQDVWAGCLRAAGGVFPGAPFAGYESGADLAVARHVRFEGIGKLRVWLWNE